MRSLAASFPPLLLLAALAAGAAPPAARSGAAGDRLTPGPDRDLPAPPPPAFARDGCTTGQTNDLNAQLGIEGEERVQTPCLPGQPGNEGDLTGFAFVVNGCLDGGIGEVAINFRIAEIGDPFYLFIWRSFAGLPVDACGLAAYGAYQTVETDLLFSIYDLCEEMIPIAEGERIFVGVVYRNITELFGPDWFIGRNALPGFPDHAYVNLSGAQGDWVDLDTLGFGNRWGIIMTNLTDCLPVAAEPSSWGAVKALWR